MVAQVGNKQLRKLTKLDVNEIILAFPMYLQVIKSDTKGMVLIDMNNYTTPESGTIFSIMDKIYECVDIIDSHPSRGIWRSDMVKPTWYRALCRNVTGAAMHYAGEDHPGMTYINLPEMMEAA